MSQENRKIILGEFMFNYKFRNKLIPFNKNTMNFNVNNKKNNYVGLNLVNPKEICDFIRDKEGILDFIIKTHILIKEHFPNAELYLKLHFDPEYDEPVCKLLTHIINDENTSYENECIYDNMLSEFFNLESFYSHFRDDYSIIIGLKP